MTLRAEKAAENRRRVVEAARELFDAQSSTFTLDEVAARSGTSVQTVLRLFGSKQHLLVETIGSGRNAMIAHPLPISVEGAVTQLFDDYEEIGDRVIRVLAEEDRVGGFSELAADGRRSHREWVEVAFGDALRNVTEPRRTLIITALLAATDVYLWKLMRRDLRLDRSDAETVVLTLVQGALGGDSD
jgi:AcrR family transcriptional regulator